MKQQIDSAGIANQQAALGESLYSVLPIATRDLVSNSRLHKLKVNFETNSNSFSFNFQEILDKFKFRDQTPTLIESDIFACLIEDFLDIRGIEIPETSDEDMYTLAEKVAEAGESLDVEGALGAAT